MFAEVDNGIPHISETGIEVDAGEFSNFFERHFAIKPQDKKFLLNFGKFADGKPKYFMVFSAFQSIKRIFVPDI